MSLNGLGWISKDICFHLYLIRKSCFDEDLLNQFIQLYDMETDERKTTVSQCEMFLHSIIVLVENGIYLFLYYPFFNYFRGTCKVLCSYNIITSRSRCFFSCKNTSIPQTWFYNSVLTFHCIGWSSREHYILSMCLRHYVVLLQTMRVVFSE